MSDAQPVPEAFAQALRELGLAGAGEIVGAPLTGGVSSDIWRIDLPCGPVCAKRALPKLRVAADWVAPIERNTFEARWMRYATEAVPGCTPRLLGQHAGMGVLVMEFLPQFALWKQQLRDGQVEVATAAAVGDTLARIHAWSAARPELAAQFASQEIFLHIRLEPYLLATARRHPDLVPPLHALVAQTQAHALALVHGDVSPKNILVDGHRPVVLDAECAVWSDPAFDLAFCLNHLLLKGLWKPAHATAYARCFDTLAASYLARVNWEGAAAVEARSARLLPGLMLARVDGKSPVEYLVDESQRDTVRRFAGARLRDPTDRLAPIAQGWLRELKS